MASTVYETETYHADMFEGPKKRTHQVRVWAYKLNCIRLFRAQPSVLLLSTAMYKYNLCCETT